MVPHGVQILFDDRSFVFRLFTRVRQQVTVGNAVSLMPKHNCSIEHVTLIKRESCKAL